MLKQDGYYLIVENIQKTYVSALMDEGINLNTIREWYYGKIMGKLTDSRK